MASTTALFTGLSGLATNARRLDVIGNNIANVNTTAFKSARMLFSPAASRTFSLGSGPTTTSGGANPNQIGLGSKITGTQRSFSNGALSATGVSTDVAIEGDGFFIVEQAGEQLYSRAGAFLQNKDKDLVTIGGGKVLGFGVDNQFSIVPGNLQELNIPIGTLTLAEATRNVTFNGNLNPSGDVGTTGSIHVHRAFYTDAGLTTLLGTTAFDLTTPGNDLYIDDGAGGSVLAFEGGQNTTITISGIEKGGKDLGTHTWGFMSAATAAARGITNFGSTVQDFMDFMDEILGLDGSTISGETLGGGLAFAAGIITFTGNEGTVQDLDIESGDIVATDDAGNATNQPFVMTKNGSADGESVRTSFVIYDSLGSPITVDLSFVLQSTSAGAGSTWEFIAESSDNDATDRIVGLGVVTFDASGNYQTTTNDTISIIRTNGAVSPLNVALDFDSGSDAITALTDDSSNLAAVFQDGSPIGTLTAFAVEETGIISGAFTNGLTRTLGQIALATFSNPEGLVDAGGNLFRIGPNSGSALITAPLTFGAGRLIGGALELSNVDLSQEFINMIMSSTGYSASSRVITTTSELLNQLIVLGR